MSAIPHPPAGAWSAQAIQRSPQALFNGQWAGGTARFRCGFCRLSVRADSLQVEAEHRAQRLARAVLERVSDLRGIRKALNILLPTPRAADEWVGSGLLLCLT